MAEGQVKDSPEQADFRAYVRYWLHENHPGEAPMPIPQSMGMLRDPEALKWLQSWQRSAYAGGLIA